MPELTGLVRRYFFESLKREECRWSSFEDSVLACVLFRGRRFQVRTSPPVVSHESGPVSVLRVGGLRAGRQNLLCGLE